MRAPSRRTNRRRAWLLRTAAALLLPLAALAAQVEDTVGEHVVQPGETLWDITRHYLGEDFLWKENWKLNPTIDDPNRLRVGQRLRVIKERKIIADRAVVSAVSNQVDKNLERSQWQPAASGDQLGERDGVRTLRDSSAELMFNDHSRLRLSEYSQVFLESKTRTLRGVDRGRIQVDAGRAELVLDAAARRAAEIELVAGSAVSRPRAGADGHSQVAAGTDADSGAARVMVYRGNSTVEASGRQVALPQGTGTAVPKDGPPSPPEPLLPAPVDLSPAAGRQWRVANQRLGWAPVSGARHYRVEICRDAACARLSQSSPALTETAWQPRLTETGAYFWRVRAVSASGLEGYSSPARSFELTSIDTDENGPVVAVIPTGPVSFADRRVIAGPEARLRLAAFDPGVGVAWLEYRWPNGDWRRVAGDSALIEIPPGAGLLEVRAGDELEQIGATQRVEIESD